MKLYLRVTKDEYELPVAVADSPRELAKMLLKIANGEKIYMACGYVKGI